MSQRQYYALLLVATFAGTVLGSVVYHRFTCRACAKARAERTVNEPVPVTVPND